MIVFTNGCFDLLHPGHVDLFKRARKLGTRLIVGLNSDRSVRAIKGADRPFVNQDDRRSILVALSAVDEVVIFDETTPLDLIKRVNPDVLVKGGDWKIDEIVGADFVLSNGGQVYSLPLKDGFSSSAIAERIRGKKKVGPVSRGGSIENSLAQHLDVFGKIAATQTKLIAACAEKLLDAFRSGNKILLCGNGGSASDAQHIAAEFVGRYETERPALPAIALTTDTSALTAIANDYGAERIFSRQVEALARTGDCLVAISTSGSSSNVIAAVITARKRGCTVVGLTGQDGTKLAGLCDVCIMVPSQRTARIQEAHIAIAHVWCEIVDARLAENSGVLSQL